MSSIATEPELRALIAEPSPKIRLKILDRLERHSRHFIATASLVAIAARTARGLSPVAVLTGRGRAVVTDDRTIVIHGWQLEPGAAGPIFLGGLVMVPGIGETLRVNGRVLGARADGVAIEVDEVFLQCPKALVRSELWNPATWRAPAPAPGPASDDVVATGTLSAAMRAFVARAPFALVATASATGQADVSPRGDPSGSFVRCLDDSTLLVPDRTGNHLVDTLRNILSNPYATMTLVIPSDPRVLQVRARASITADAAVLAPSAVKGKPPRVGVLLAIEHAGFVPDALAGAWLPGGLTDPKDFPSMGEMILDQVNPGGGAVNRIGSVLFDLGSTFHKKRRLY